MLDAYVGNSLLTQRHTVLIVVTTTLQLVFSSFCQQSENSIIAHFNGKVGSKMKIQSLSTPPGARHKTFLQLLIQREDE